MSTQLGAETPGLSAAAPLLYYAAKLDEAAAAHWEACRQCGTGSSFGTRNGCGVYMNLIRDAQINRRRAIARAEGE